MSVNRSQNQYTQNWADASHGVLAASTDEAETPDRLLGFAHFPIEALTLRGQMPPEQQKHLSFLRAVRVP